MTPAPFHQDVALGPKGTAHWLTAADGLRIRVAHWLSDAPKGTILLFPGRTEHCEKYGLAAGDLVARGYSVAAIDWRGQGLADRMNEDRGLGHVGQFPDYQQDVAAMLAHVRDLKLPEPYFLLAHSMGGCIGLRALFEGLPVKAAAFSAPMWGIQVAPVLKPVMWAVTNLARRLGMQDRVMVTQDTKGYLDKVTFETNTLTNDREMFEYMRHQIRSYPDLMLGGPSIHWIDQAKQEMDGLAARLSPATPSVTFLGSDEQIVDPERIRDRMAQWPGGTLVEVETGKHEMMMDAPEMRDRVFDGVTRLFDAHS